MKNRKQFVAKLICNCKDNIAFLKKDQERITSPSELVDNEADILYWQNELMRLEGKL